MPDATPKTAAEIAPEGATETASKPGRRDRLLVLLLLGIVVAALAFGYRPGSASAPAQAAAPGTGFSLTKAMALAGQELPENIDSYYFFAFTDAAPPEQEIGDLAEKLEQASKEHDYLGIAGPDEARNRRNLLAALRASRGRDLGGVTVIYVGPAAQREEISRALKAAGAPFRYVVYPASEL